MSNSNVGQDMPSVNPGNSSSGKTGQVAPTEYDKLAAIAGLPLRQEVLCRCLVIDKRTLQRYIAAGCPVSHIGKRRFFIASQVSAWASKFSGELPEYKAQRTGPKKPRTRKK